MNRACQNCIQDFTIESQDLVFYDKIGVPSPTHCPDCRYQRRIANRNEWNFYKRNCSLCKVSMVTIYNQSYPGPVYCQPCWWSDKWNPMDYGREIDFTKPFFEQFFTHRYSIPRIALANAKSTNSEYSNQSENNKNCYMVVATSESEDCMYGNWNQICQNCLDCWAMNECQFMYESLNCRKCYRCQYAEDCIEVTESYFVKDCKGCSNCFSCVGLRNKSYHWLNEPLSKEDYEKRMSEVNWTREDIEKLKKDFQSFCEILPVKYYHGNQNENSTGDYISNNRNVRNAFNCRRSENLKFGQDAWEARDCMDLTETLDNELDYEMEGAGWGSNSKFSSKSWYNNDILYSELNFNCNDIFGCLALRKKSYCILNKQYRKEEYQELKQKLIDHMKQSNEWGEFFPVSISPFPYNDSLAQDYFPLTKEEAQSKGWGWHERDLRTYKTTLSHEELPNNIRGITETILNEVVSCSSQTTERTRTKYLRCATAFRLHRDELIFYKALNIPVPNKCFPCRLQDRLDRRNHRKLTNGKCMCKSGSHNEHPKEGCENEFETAHTPDYKKLVCCEQCYQSEIA